MVRQVRNPGHVCTTLISDQAGLYVPSNHLQFVAGLSEKLAAAVPKVALSFLSELFVALESAHAEHAAIYIHCVRPWIPHLAQFTAISRDEAEATQLKLRRLFRSMIEVSCRGGSVSILLQEIPFLATLTNIFLLRT